MKHAVGVEVGAGFVISWVDSSFQCCRQCLKLPYIDGICLFTPQTWLFKSTLGEIASAATILWPFLETLTSSNLYIEPDRLTQLSYYNLCQSIKASGCQLKSSLAWYHVFLSQYRCNVVVVLWQAKTGQM